MRRFNLMSTSRTGDVDEEAAPEREEAPPSKRRLFFLGFLLFLVIAVGFRNLIARPLGRGIGGYLGQEIKRYFERGSGVPVPPPARTVVPQAQQVPSASTGSPSPPTAVPSERSPIAAGSRVAPDAGVAVKLPPARTGDGEVAQPGARPASGSLRGASKAPTHGRYSVQVGAMAHEANAIALSRKLEQLGYDVTIRQRRAPATQHIVLVESPPDKTEADALAERLRVEGIPAVLGESNGRFRVEVGRSAMLDQAIDLAHELQKKGFTPKISSEAGSNALYMVRVGEFASRDEAGERARELRRKGFQAIIVRK